MLRNRGRTPLAPATGEYQHKTRRAASSTRPIKPRQPPRRHQRGIGAVEYLVGTGVLLTVLLAPFGASNQNVIQRLIHAVQRQQAAYEYVAGLPSLPRGPGALSGLPGAIPVDGSGPGAASGAGNDPDPGAPGPGSSTGGSASAGNAGSSSGSSTSGASGPVAGGGGNPEPDGNNPGDPGKPAKSDDDSDASSDGGGGLGWKALLAAATAVAYIGCKVSDDESPQLTTEDYRAWLAAKQSYSDDGAGFDELGIRYQQPRNGFSASLYKQPDGSYILAFRGTEPLSAKDWWADGDQALTGKNLQYEQAVSLARKVVDKAGDKSVLFAGHSLGGGMASAAAYATSGRAITFNAAGLSAYYKKGTPGEIRAHYIKHEFLTDLQKLPGLPRSAGTHIAHSANCSLDPARRHRVGTFQESFDRWRMANGIPAKPNPSGLDMYQANAA